MTKETQKGGEGIVRGLYTGALGMTAGMERVDVLSHNIANVGTTAFRRMESTSRSFAQLLARHERRPTDGRAVSTPIGHLGVGTQVDGTYLCCHAGPRRETGSQLHAAIEGEAFFVIEAADGERYTRDGRFLVDEAGWLVTLEGQRVLGEEGPLHVGQGEARLGASGEVLRGEETLGRLRLVEFANPAALEAQGSNLYRATVASGQPTAERSDLAVGFVEESNVNVAFEMVELIAATRAYEANQRVVVAYDDCLGKAVSEVGRV